MEFRFDDEKQIVSHWVLEDLAVCEAIAETDDWKRNEKMTARVTVNGVELSFESLGRVIMGAYERACLAYAEQYADVEKEVERRLKERLEKEAQCVIDALGDLQFKLEDVTSIIKPYWEEQESLK